MITRIETEGSTSFADFPLDVPPFLLLVGANAGGESGGVLVPRAGTGARSLCDPAAFRTVRGADTAALPPKPTEVERVGGPGRALADALPASTRRPCSTASGGT